MLGLPLRLLIDVFVLWGPRSLISAGAHFPANVQANDLLTRTVKCLISLVVRRSRKALPFLKSLDRPGSTEQTTVHGRLPNVKFLLRSTV